MRDRDCCDIIRDLLPGYIDGILSGAGTEAVKTHLETCGECRRVYEEMKCRIGEGEKPEEMILVDGLKKIRKRTGRLKLAVGIVSGLLAAMFICVCLVLYVIGEPVSTSQIEIFRTDYEEESGNLVIEGRIDNTYSSFGKAVWEASAEDADAVHVMIYDVRPYPGHEGTGFSVTVPDAKGKKVYLACPDYDRMELYNWKHDHYEQVDFLEEEIYRRVPGLDRKKDILNYSSGIWKVDGEEGILFDVEYLMGEDVTLWRFDDQLITDGDLEPAEYGVWISLKEPYRILFYDYETGEYTEGDAYMDR